MKRFLENLIIACRKEALKDFMVTSKDSGAILNRLLLAHYGKI